MESPAVLRDISLGLDRIRALLTLIGSPNKQLQTSTQIIHITGTNGKGSTATMLASQLRLVGHTGLFTSPHAVHPGDAILVLSQDSQISQGLTKTQYIHNRQGILDVYAKSELASSLGPPSEFELAVAVALQHFAKQEALRFLVIEVGMGGARDATNVFDAVDRKFPIISVLTEVSLDHQEFLGNSLAEICREKLGIVKDGGHLVVGQWLPACCLEIVSETRQVLPSCQVHIVREREDMQTPLRGEHQKRNCALVCEILRILDLNYNPHISVHHPARLQEVKIEGVRVLIDGCHNEQGIDALRAYISAAEPRGVRRCWIVGFTGDKTHLVGKLPVAATTDLVIFAKFNTDTTFMPWMRVADPLSLGATIGDTYRWVTAENVKEAFATAIANEYKDVVVCGSLYLGFDFLATQHI